MIDPLTAHALQEIAMYGITGGSPALFNSTSMINRAAQVVGIQTQPAMPPVQRAGYISNVSQNQLNQLTTMSLDNIAGSAGRYLTDTFGSNFITNPIRQYAGRFAMGQLGMGEEYQQIFHNTVGAAADYGGRSTAGAMAEHLVSVAQQNMANMGTAAPSNTYGMSQAEYAAMAGRMVTGGALDQRRLEDQAIDTWLADAADGPDKGITRETLMRRLRMNSELGARTRAQLQDMVKDKLADAVQGRARLLDRGKQFFGDKSAGELEQALKQQYGDFDKVSSETIQGRLTGVERLSKTFKTNVETILKAQRNMVNTVEQIRQMSTEMGGVGDVALVDPTTGMAVRQSGIAQGTGAQIGAMATTIGNTMGRNFRHMSEAEGRSIVNNIATKTVGSTLEQRLQVAGMAMETGALDKDVYNKLVEAARSGNYAAVGQYDLALKAATGITDLNNAEAMTGFINDATFQLNATGRNGESIGREIAIKASKSTIAGATSRIGMNLGIREMNRDIAVNESVRRSMRLSPSKSTVTTSADMLDAMQEALAANAAAYGFGKGDTAAATAMMAELTEVSKDMTASELQSYINRSYGEGMSKLGRVGYMAATEDAYERDTKFLSKHADTLELARFISGRDTGKDSAVVKLSGEQRVELAELRRRAGSGDAAAVKELDTFLQGLKGTDAVNATMFDHISGISKESATTLRNNLKQTERNLMKNKVEGGLEVIREEGTKTSELGGENYVRFMRKKGLFQGEGAHEDLTEASAEFLQSQHESATKLKRKKGGHYDRRVAFLAFASGQAGKDLDWDKIAAGNLDPDEVIVGGSTKKLKEDYHNFRREMAGKNKESREHQATHEDKVDAAIRNSKTGKVIAEIPAGTKIELSDSSINALAQKMARVINEKH